MQLKDIPNLKAKEDLLFWNDHLVSKHYSKLNSQQLHLIAAICQELTLQDINPEEYFSMNQLDISYFELVEALGKLKSNN